MHVYGLLAAEQQTMESFGEGAADHMESFPSVVSLPMVDSSFCDEPTRNVIAMQAIPSMLMI